jgi:hypothetical protein
MCKLAIAAHIVASVIQKKNGVIKFFQPLYRHGSQNVLRSTSFIAFIE